MWKNNMTVLQQKSKHLLIASLFTVHINSVHCTRWKDTRTECSSFTLLLSTTVSRIIKNVYVCVSSAFLFFTLRCAPQLTRQRRPQTSRTRWPCFPGWKRPRASTAAAAAVPWPPPWPPRPRPPRSAAGGSHQTYLMCRNLHRDSGLRGNPPRSPAPPGPWAWTPTQALSRRRV